jgi:hypothetical protein
MINAKTVGVGQDFLVSVKKEKRANVMLRIRWFSQRIKSSVRNVIYTPKWWYQRVTRGYSDRDMWNGDFYLSWVFAGVLQWYIDKSRGVNIAYAEGLDHYNPDTEIMALRRNEEYSRHIEIFQGYFSNGTGWSKKAANKLDEVTDEDVKDSVRWLADHFTELWD